MKQKILLTSLLGLTMVCPAMAEVNVDITAGTNNPGCNNTVLHTYSGPTQLEAEYTANTININFYTDENTVYSTGTCTYDGSITLPEEDPTRTGYTFDGWQVRRAAAHAQQCDLSGLSDTTTNGVVYAYIQFDGTESTVSSGIQTPDTYNITNNGEWAAEFYHGIVKGISRCSTVGNGYTMGQTGNPTDDLNVEDAPYCWCQMTGYTPKPWVYDTGDSSSSPIYLTGYTNQSNCKTAIQAITGLRSSKANTLLNNASSANPQLITNATGANVAYLTDMGCTTSGGASGHFGENGNECPVASLWVFRSDNGTAASCASNCANHCGSAARAHEALRVGLFGVTE